MQEISSSKQESCAQSIVEHISSGLTTMNQPVLVVLCGPSHAGKSTFSRKFQKDFTVISSDKIRGELHSSFGEPEIEARVWNIFESMKCKALEENRNVIIDACHISKQARWHSLQGPNRRHRKICVVFDLPFRTIRDRCLKAKRVSLNEVERMWNAFEKSKPTAEDLRLEGFDEIYFVGERSGSLFSGAIFIACIAGHTQKQ